MITKAVLIIAALLMVGCAEKKKSKPSPHLFLSKDCIMGFLPGTMCKQVGSSDTAICDGVVVKFACVKVKQ